MSDTSRPFLVSATGHQHGFGSDRWKWISGLTAEERSAVRTGTATVLITGSRPCTQLPVGLQDVRRVILGNGRSLAPRLPFEADWERIAQILGRSL